MCIRDRCRNVSPNTKVLATAFSNVGADNLASAMMDVGLKVVRLGKASATAENLWNHTLDAAIERDPKAQKALEKAAAATSQLSRRRRPSKGSAASLSSSLSERTLRDVATAAVKAANEVRRCLVAVVQSLR